ncbi:MAG: pyridoxamine 5'-phosphate oxidase family protein [Desulfobacterales bacterium]
MSEKLMEYFNKQPRLGTLSTADKDGNVNVAYFGSPRMVDEKTVFMGLGNNRTFANLQENPKAVFMIMEPGNTLPEWKGVRVYLKMIDCQTSGKKVDSIKAVMAEKAGENAAEMIHAAVTFEVAELRPLADFGQGWEQSI